MVTGSVDICNLALDNLGVTNKITALTDQTKEAQACNRWYTHVRDLVLRSFPWPFATRTKDLVASATETHPEWAYVYDLPADLLKVRRLTVLGQRRPRERIPFSTGQNSTATGMVLMADVSPATLIYTPKFDTDAKVAKLPETLVEAITFKLSTKLVLPLALDAGLAERAEAMFKAVVLDAFAVESQDQEFDPEPESEFITIRG